jgi:hypothetical protein
MSRTVYAACAVTLALGLIFVFVWAPHPWGWEGFDHYHQLALAVAEGAPFPTMEVPWGYAYFLAAFYRAFGNHPSIPLVAQVALNALMPWLVFAYARTWLDMPTAILAAVLIGFFSFNTVYASTQSADALCTCAFMAAILAFADARRKDDARRFAVVGLLTGLTPQLRPNLIMIPAVLAVFAVWEQRTIRRLFQSVILLICAGAVLMPWVIRNYRLTHTLLPTSVHGGVQFWYGTLQTGPYLRSRAYNPRSVFDAAAFDYTSLDDVPIIVETQLKACAAGRPTSPTLVYWFDRDRREQRATPIGVDSGWYTFEIPAPSRDAIVYYYFTTRWSQSRDHTIITTPAAGQRAPFVYFVSQNHLGDLDTHGDLVDVFDLVRLIRREAWSEALPFDEALRAAEVADSRAAVFALARPLVPDEEDRAMLVSAVRHDASAAHMTFRDGSTLTIPRVWDGEITSLAFDRGLAASLMTESASLAELALNRDGPPRSHDAACAEFEDVRVNQVFYRKEPHMMRRYAALAFDNIRRDPSGFLVACLYRAVRLFVIQGTDDHRTAQQFARSRPIYVAATAASAAYLTLFLAGVAIAWRAGYDFGLPLLLILYVPATIAPMLTNMRYTVTVQPLVFMFVAVMITALWRRRHPSPAAAEESGFAGSRTARQL